MNARCRSLALVVLLLAACDTTGGSETGNPVVSTHMGLGVRSGDPELIGVRSGSGGAVLEHAWLAFGEVTLLDQAQCANLGEIDIFGPTRVAEDLVQGGTEIALQLAAQSYCGLALPLNLNTPADQLPDDAPQELASHSIVLRGERADGTAFELMHSEQETLELAATGGEFALERDSPDLLLYFDVAKWLDGIDLDAAAAGDDGVIHIDVDSNQNLLDAYEANLECSLELFYDEDGDGEVSQGDRSLATCFED